MSLHPFVLLAGIAFLAAAHASARADDLSLGTKLGPYGFGGLSENTRILIVEPGDATFAIEASFGFHLLPRLDLGLDLLATRYSAPVVWKTGCTSGLSAGPSLSWHVADVLKGAPIWLGAQFLVPVAGAPGEPLPNLRAVSDLPVGSRFVVSPFVNLNARESNAGVGLGLRP